MDNSSKRVSILYPTHISADYHIVSEVSLHDLGMDSFVKDLTGSETEQKAILKILSKITDNADVCGFRAGVFDDIYKNPSMCENMTALLDKVDFLKEYGSLKKKYDENVGVWELLHNLEELNEYIGYVEALYKCLDEADIHSDGLILLKEHIEKIYHDNGYDALKKDIARLKASTDNLKSVTVGINLNDRFEAESLGLISLNRQPFLKSNILGEFYDKISSKDKINDDTSWDENYKYHQVKPGSDTGFLEETARFTVAARNPLLYAGLASVPSADSSQDITRYMNREATHLLSFTVRNLRETLSRYLNVTITDVTDLIPEFMFYIRFADRIRKLEKKGMSFVRPVALKCEPFSRKMHARGIYNIKLIDAAIKNNGTIVKNDLDFDEDKIVYILTGANRGGKTTITQAVGQLFLLSQNGIYVPGDGFEYEPVDNIFTHFPADEDKTLDLGRLGEECKRFREIFFEATGKSLILLNETFSTTSFEEGYYIAHDSVNAIADKKIRAIYNTHMHKLAFEMTKDESDKNIIRSLIIRSDGEENAFKIAVSKPEGQSYAQSIAKRYGVTYESLMGEKP